MIVENTISEKGEQKADVSIDEYVALVYPKWRTENQLQNKKDVLFVLAKDTGDFYIEGMSLLPRQLQELQATIAMGDYSKTVDLAIDFLEKELRR